MKHRLIVVEGIDGAGKATQVKLLVDRLRKEGKKVTQFSFPRYHTAVGKFIKAALHGAYGNFVRLSPEFSALPFMLDNALSKGEIEKALKHGIVVFDRYTASTIAYQASKVRGREQKQLIALLENLYRDIDMPKADATLYLKMSVSHAQKLLAKKAKDQNERNTAYQKRVARVYDALSKKPRWQTILCAKGATLLPPKAIHEKIWKIVGR